MSPIADTGNGLSVLAEMAQGSCTALPVPTLERNQIDPPHGFLIEAPQINTVAVRIGTRDVKRLDSAHRAEQVPGHPGIESIVAQHIRTGQ